MRKSWCTMGLGLGLVLCLAGCQSLFPQPVYTPPVAPAPQPPPPPPQVARPTFYVTVNRLNLRACPGMDCPKIAVLDRNQEVEKVGDAEDWSQIRIKQSGTIGWVSSRYLSTTPVAAAPEVAPPPTPPEAGDAAAASGNSGQSPNRPLRAPRRWKNLPRRPSPGKAPPRPSRKNLKRLSPPNRPSRPNRPNRWEKKPRPRSSRW